MALNSNLIDTKDDKKKVNALIPGFNSGVYNNPRKRYDNIFSYNGNTKAVNKTINPRRTS